MWLALAAPEIIAMTTCQPESSGIILIWDFSQISLKLKSGDLQRRDTPL
jgi:hypothetical protein